MRPFLKPSLPYYDSGMKCWVYPTKPEGNFESAAPSDLINSDGSVKANTMILEYNKRIEIYYAWRIPEYFSAEALLEMISNNEIFIKK